MDNLKKKIVLFGVFTLSIIISFVLGRLGVINSYKLVNVPFASDYLQTRTLIKNKDIKYAKIPSSLLNEDILTNESEIIGKYVNARSFINRGSFFFKDSIEDISSMKDGDLLKVSNDETVFDLFVKNIDVNAAHVNSNMYVDLYLTIDKPIIISDLLVGNVKICGLYNNNYEDIQNIEKRNNLAIISMVVNDEMIPLLNKAQLIGKLSIVPTNNPYEAKNMYINKEGEIMNYIN